MRACRKGEEGRVVPSKVDGRHLSTQGWELRRRSKRAWRGREGT